MLTFYTFKGTLKYLNKHNWPSLCSSDNKRNAGFCAMDCYVVYNIHFMKYFFLHKSDA